MSSTKKELLSAHSIKRDVDRKKSKEKIAAKNLNFVISKYPTLVISTRTLFNNTVEVQFTTHHSADRSPVVLTKVLSQVEALNLPSDNHAKISLNANGSISIDGELNTYLRIETDKNIEFSKPLNAKGFSVDANAVLINSKLTFAAGVLELSSKNTIHNHGEISANERIILNARSLENTHSIISDKIKIDLSTINKQKYGKFKNTGTLIGMSHLSIKSKGEVINAEASLLLSKAKLTVRTASGFINDSIIYGATGVFISSGRMLQNKGKISSDSITLSSSDEFQNAGTIYARQKLVINSKAVNNLIGGKLCSLGTILAAVTQYFKNADTVVSLAALSITSEMDIINEKTGIIGSELQQLHFVSLRDINNAGKISAYKHVSIASGKTMTNQANASLYAKEILSLIAVNSLNNLGSLLGEKLLDIKSYGEALNAKSGSLHSYGDIIFSAFEDLINAGLAKADNILAQSFINLHNTESGVFVAAHNLQIKASYGLENAGLGQGQEVQVSGTTVHNTDSGALIAFNKLQLEASQSMQNAGWTQGYKVGVLTRTLKNSGVISSLTELSMLVEEVLLHCSKGTISAEKAISILAENLYLMGKLIAKGNFNATIKNGFDYNSETLKVLGILNLCLLEGYNFKKPIDTFGPLTIHSPKDIQIQTQLRTQRYFSIASQNLTIIKDGIVALGTLVVNIQEHLQTLHGTHLLSQGSMHLQTETLQHKGDIITLGNLVAESLKSIVNLNKIVAHGHAYFISPQTHLVPNSELRVGKSCIIKGDATSINATLRVGGQFSCEGSFVYHSYELDARIAEENARIKAIIKKAKRQQRKKMFKKIISMAISSVITSGLPPLLFSGFGKMGMAIARSTLFGGLNAAIGGGKPLKSALQAGVISGFGQGIGGILQLAVKTDLLREALMTASTMGFQAALHGKIVPKDILFSIGTNALNSFLIPANHNPSQMHGVQGAIQGISETAFRSFVSTSMSSLVNRTNFSKNFLYTALEGSVQTVADSLGHNLSQRLMEFDFLAKKYEPEITGGSSFNMLNATPHLTRRANPSLRVGTQEQQFIETKTRMDNTSQPYTHRNSISGVPSLRAQRSNLENHSQRVYVNSQSPSTDRNRIRNTPLSVQQRTSTSHNSAESRLNMERMMPSDLLGKGGANRTPSGAVIVIAKRRDPMSLFGGSFPAARKEIGKAKNYYTPKALFKREGDKSADGFLKTDKRHLHSGMNFIPLERVDPKACYEKSFLENAMAMHQLKTQGYMNATFDNHVRDLKQNTTSALNPLTMFPFNINQNHVIQNPIITASHQRAIQSQAYIYTELDIRCLHSSPSLKPDFQKLKFMKSNGKDIDHVVFAKEVEVTFALKPSTAYSLTPNYEQFKSSGTSPVAQLSKIYNTLLVERDSQGTRMLFNQSYRSSAEGQIALQATKKDILNRYAAIGGSVLGAAYSIFLEPLIALSVAYHLVDSDTIYDPEFQAELGRQGQIAKQQLKGFISHPYDSSCTSIINQLHTFQSLYKEGRGLEAGFVMGSYASDVVGYAFAAKGAAQGALKVTMFSLRATTPIVVKGAASAVSTFKEASVPITEFLAHNALRSPITLQFDACRLSCGFPVDSIKFRKPFNVRIPVRDRLVFGGPQNPPVKGRVYMPQDQQFKHHPNGHGSTNPIRDNKVLQELLDTAYSVPDKKQVYNIHNRKLMKFETNGMEGYHAYEVKADPYIPVLDQIPEEVLNKMHKDGLLTAHEVKKLKQNREIK